MSRGGVHGAFGLVRAFLRGPPVILRAPRRLVVLSNLADLLEAKTRIQLGRPFDRGVCLGRPFWAASSTTLWQRPRNGYCGDTWAMGQQRAFCTAKAADAQIGIPGEQDNLAAALAQNATEIREVKERLKEVEERILEERATGEESLYFKSLLDEKNKLLDKENKLMDEKNKLLDKENKLLDKENKLMDEKNKLLDIQKVMLEKSTTARSTDGVEITTATGTFTLHGVTESKHALWEHMGEVELEEIGDTQPAIDQTAGDVPQADDCVNMAEGVERDNQSIEDVEAEGEAPSSGRMLLMKVPAGLMYLERLNKYLALDSTRLVIRSEAIKAANVVMEHVKQMIDAQLPIIGIPGIGKTLLSNYLLKLCWDAHIPVILHDLKDDVLQLLRRGEPTLETSKDSRQRKPIFQAFSGQPILYLCDTGVETTRSPHMFDRFRGVTVLTTSPDSKHFGQWTKAGIRYLWLPPWSEAELRVALPYLLVDPSETKLAMVMERYKAVGGTLRQLTSIQDGFNSYVKEANRAVSKGALAPNQLLAMMRELSSSGGSQLDAVTRKISHKVLHVWPSPIDEDIDDSKPLVQTLFVRFASDRFEERVIQAWNSSAADVVAHAIRQLSQDSQCSSAAGNLYEDLFYSRLRGAVTASIWTAVPDSGTAEESSLAARLLEAAQLPQEKALDGSEVQLNVGVYHSREAGPLVPCAGLLVRARKNFPGIDGWLYVELADGEREIWLLQNTMAVSHDINQGMREGVDLARVYDWSDAPYRLVFVVPGTRVSVYRTKRQSAIKVTDEDRDGSADRSIGRRPALVWKMDVVDLMQMDTHLERRTDDE